MTSKAAPQLTDLAALTALSQAINERCKSVNDQLLEFEQLLKSLNLSVSAWVTDQPLETNIGPSMTAAYAALNQRPDDKNVKEEIQYVLGFDKTSNGKHRLVIGTITRDVRDTAYVSEEGRLGVTYPALEATLGLRIKALSPSIQNQLVTQLKVRSQSCLCELDADISSAKRR